MSTKSDFINQFSNIFEKKLMEELRTEGTYLSLKQDEVLLNVGDTIRQIPLVLSGTVKVSRIDEAGNEILLYYVAPQESCAMTFTCCMEHTSSEIKATAEEDVELLSIPIQKLESWMRTYPSWNSFVMRTIKARFNELLHTIDEIAFYKLDERLLSYLKEKSELAESKVLNLSHQEIATDLASSREVISRLLKRLENEKKVILYRNQIKLLRQL